MTKFFYVFLLTLLLSSGRYQFDAPLSDPLTLDKVIFDTEDSELKEFENLPKHLKSYSEQVETPEERKAITEDKVRRHFPYKKVRGPLAEVSSRIFNNFEGNVGKIDAFDSLGKCKNVDGLHPKDMIDWKLKPLDVSSIRASMEKISLIDTTKEQRDSERYVSRASGPNRHARYLDYTNSQMPFNEGKIRRKGFQPKYPEVADGVLINKKNNLDFERCLEAEKMPKRSGRSLRRRRFEVPLRWRNFEVPRDDPLLEYSRVRRFLDHKRAKKQIRMTSTLEAKEAAMSRVLDPNLNLDGILEPHVRKRRGLRTSKRNLSFKPMYTRQ